MYGEILEGLSMKNERSLLVAWQSLRLSFSPLASLLFVLVMVTYFLTSKRDFSITGATLEISEL
jgi:hypothetical protein